jgi:hypothetical protein
MISTRDKIGRAVGSCLSCGAGIATDDQTAGTRASCPRCGTMATLAYVFGEHSETPCDGSCMAAIGKICSCSCGGVNHGRWNVAIELVPVWEQDQARAAQAKRVRDFRERAERKATVAQDKADAGRAALLAEYPDLAFLADEAWSRDNVWSTFMIDMKRYFLAGDMTPRQASAAASAVKRTNDKIARTAKIDAERAAVVASGATVAAGRREIAGEIVSAKETDDLYSRYGGTIVKITVKLADGTAVWGTLPKSAYDAEAPVMRSQDSYVAWFRGLTGRTITFTGTVEPSDKDQTFGFFKRPAKITLH